MRSQVFAGPVDDCQRFRFVVATDWSPGIVPLTMMRSFGRYFPLSAPVDLVFAVPHDPGITDIECVRVLASQPGVADDISGLTLESFQECTEKPCHAAVIPQGDCTALIVEIGVALTAMHELALLLSLAPTQPIAPLVESINDRSDVSSRLSRYVEPAL